MKTEDESKKIESLTEMVLFVRQLDIDELIQVVTQENINTLVEFIANGEKESEVLVLRLLSTLAELGAQLTDPYKDNLFLSLLGDRNCVSTLVRLLTQINATPRVRFYISRFIAFTYKYESVDPMLLRIVVYTLLEEFARERDNPFPEPLAVILQALFSLSQNFGFLLCSFLNLTFLSLHRKSRRNGRAECSSLSCYCCCTLCRSHLYNGTLHPERSGTDRDARKGLPPSRSIDLYRRLQHPLHCGFSHCCHRGTRTTPTQTERFECSTGSAVTTARAGGAKRHSHHCCIGSFVPFSETNSHN